MAASLAVGRDGSRSRLPIPRGASRVAGFAGDTCDLLMGQIPDRFVYSLFSFTIRVMLSVLRAGRSNRPRGFGCGPAPSGSSTGWHATTTSGRRPSRTAGCALKCAPGIGPSESRRYGTATRTDLREESAESPEPGPDLYAIGNGRRKRRNRGPLSATVWQSSRMRRYRGPKHAGSVLSLRTTPRGRAPSRDTRLLL
jgi:hypothetical protein